MFLPILLLEIVGLWKAEYKFDSYQVSEMAHRVTED